MNKVLVTGGAGFIGSNLARLLLERGHVTVLDNLSSGYRENLDLMPRQDSSKATCATSRAVDEARRGARPFFIWRPRSATPVRLSIRARL